MALSTYAELQTAVLNWLARPGDPLVAPSVPDMITLFEREARRRLRCGGAEQRAYMSTTTATVGLPYECRELRLVTSGGRVLDYVTPAELPGGSGVPCNYTLYGANQMQLGPGPSGSVVVEILYQTGIPALSDSNPTNWLFTEHPDVYLFGTLGEAELFIGHDERAVLWGQRRELAFASIEQADRKARWGGPLTIIPDIYGAPMSDAWTVVVPTPPEFLDGVDVSGSGPLPPSAAGDINISNNTGAPITIGMPPYPIDGQVLRFKDVLGNAALFPINITGAIDGGTSYTLFSNYAAVELYWTGTQWGVR